MELERSSRSDDRRVSIHAPEFENARRMTRCLRRAGAGLAVAALAVSASAAATPSGVMAVTAPNGDRMLMLHGPAITAAPVSQTTRDLMHESWQTQGAPNEKVFLVNTKAAAAIEKSLARGAIDPSLLAYLEPLDDQPASSGCQDVVDSWSEDMSFAWDGESTGFAQGVFAGNLSVDGEMSAEATAEVHYKKKRFSFFGWCLTYWVELEHVRAYGDALIDGAITVDGEVTTSQDPWQWQWEIYEFDLGEVSFWVGPVYLELGFAIPITAGLDLGVTIEATLDYDTGGTATGSFDYTCDFGGCSGTSALDFEGFEANDTVNGSIEGRVEATPWLDVAFKAHLYSDSFAWAQVGLRPKLYADLWGYWGNLCGDRDGDGSQELVHALTLDVDWQIFINGSADAFFSDTWSSDDLWHTDRHHLFFWDVIGSSALEPLGQGADSTVPHQVEAYNTGMGSCWPYSDSMVYAVGWGDGESETVSNPPDVVSEVEHSWQQEGLYAATFTAVADSHGRVLDASTIRTVEVADDNAGEFMASLYCDGPIHGASICTATVTGGLPPYTPRWQVLFGEPVYDDAWWIGDLQEVFTCKEDQGQAYTLRFQAEDSTGETSSLLIWECGDGGGPPH